MCGLLYVSGSIKEARAASTQHEGFQAWVPPCEGPDSLQDHVGPRRPFPKMACPVDDPKPNGALGQAKTCKSVTTTPESLPTGGAHASKVDRIQERVLQAHFVASQLTRSTWPLLLPFVVPKTQDKYGV